LSSAGFDHAFFTRCGGFSLPPFDSLNFSIHVGDHPDAVGKNFAVAANVLDVPPDRILFLRQVHGTTTHLVAPSDNRDRTSLVEGDAIMADDPSVACSVRIADCAPVLLADVAHGTVAAVHSGWRGTEQNIVAHTLRIMHARAANTTLAAVGPHIERCCFEVGHDVAARLARTSPVADVVHVGPRGRPHVDLRRILHAQLLEAGVSPNHIEHVRGCTMCDAKRFFSHRRDGARSGRLLAAIVPRNRSW